MRLLSIFLILSSTTVFCQPTSFQQTFNSNCSFDISRCIKSTSDGGMIVLTSSGFASPGCVHLLRLSSAGGVVWTHSFETYANPNFNSLMQTSDNGFVFTGVDNGILHIIKTDSGGNVNWTKQYADSSGMDFYNSCLIEDTGGFLLAGSVGLSNSRDIFMMKTDLSGNVLWQQVYSLVGFQTPYALHKNSFGYFIAGQNSYLGGQNFLIINTDGLGQFNWSKLYSTQFATNGLYIEEIPGAGLVVTGHEGWQYHITTMKIDQSGNVSWCKNYSSSTQMLSGNIKNTADGGMITCATSANLGLSEASPIIYKIDQAGNVLWAKECDTITAGLTTMDITSDGSVIAAGYKTISDSLVYDIYIVKTDSSSGLRCNEFISVMNSTDLAVTDSLLSFTPSSFSIIDFPTPLGISGNLSKNDICNTVGVNELNSEPMTIYPNPNNGSFMIQKKLLTKPMQLTVFNITGGIVYNQFITDSHLNHINTDFCPGIYFLRLLNGENTFVTKMVVE